AALVAQPLRDRGQEGDDVVLHLRLDGLHALHVDAGVAPQDLRGRCRYLGAGGELVDQGQLHLQPALEARLVRPQRRHLGPTVARDHSGPFPALPAPVLPKPPSPRELAGRTATSRQAIRVTGATTSCATRPPRRTVAGACPTFTSRTRISPPYSA